MQQLYYHSKFLPNHQNQLTSQKKGRAMKNLFFNVEKKYGVQRKYTTIDNATSPKVVLVIGTIEAKQ